MKLYNSFTKEKEIFTPFNSEHVKMYVCGPTVYDYAHIGNARAFVTFDLLYRCLRYLFPQVTYVRNITDLDDKIYDKAHLNGENFQDLTKRTTQFFHEDMEALHCLPPTYEPRATNHITDMCQIIQLLLEKDHAYEVEGHVLFDVSSYPQYGALSKRSGQDMLAGARVDIASYKRSADDFILWKPSTPEQVGWESPWGRGRPGWHIECSAMSHCFLGTNFDIHGGGMDLLFPHHENERAQSLCAHPEGSHAAWWVHNGFVTLRDTKMSKSLGNMIRVHDLRKQHIKGEVIRYVLLSVHYRKPLELYDTIFEDAKKKLDSLYRALEDAHISAHTIEKPTMPPGLDDDMNIASALALLQKLAGDIHKTTDMQEKEHFARALLGYGHFLGLLSSSPAEWFGRTEDTHIQESIAKRNQARLEKNWEEADRIRKLLLEQNIILEDLPGNQSSWRRQ